MEKSFTAKLNNDEPNRDGIIWGLDCGIGSDCTVMCECHYENGKLVIDRFIQPKPELGEVDTTVL
jgi:hypothetical protein